jgi:hypothetical protein
MEACAPCRPLHRCQLYDSKYQTVQVRGVLVSQIASVDRCTSDEHLMMETDSASEMVRKKLKIMGNVARHACSWLAGLTSPMTEWFWSPSTKCSTERGHEPCLENLTDYQLSKDALCFSMGSFSFNMLSTVMSGILSGLLDEFFQPDQFFFPISELRVPCISDWL